MRRVRFVKDATKSGWDWLVELSNHLGAAALVLLMLGISAFSAARLPHWWLGLIILAAFYVVLFGEGAFRIWRAENGAATAAQKQAAELRAEAARQPAADRDQLIQTVKLIQGLVATDQMAHFGGAGTSHEQAFAVHFRRLKDQIDEWNIAVDWRRQAPEKLSERLASELDTREACKACSESEELVKHLATWLVSASLDGELGNSPALRWQVWEDAVPPAPNWTPGVSIQTGSVKVAVIKRDPKSDLEKRVRVITNAVDQLFRDAQGWDEAKEVRYAQDAVDELRPGLLRVLDHHLHVSPLVAEECPYCRAHLDQGA